MTNEASPIELWTPRLGVISVALRDAIGKEKRATAITLANANAMIISCLANAQASAATELPAQYLSRAEEIYESVQGLLPA
jgi:hypothetical protein